MAKDAKSFTSGEECGERTGEVAISGELINGHFPIDGHIRVADDN